MRQIKNFGQQYFEFETWEETVNKLELKTFDNPENDAQRLFNAQYEFICSKFTDQGAEFELFRLSEIVCKRLVKKELKRQGVIFYYNRDDIEILADIATDYWIKRYRKNWYERGDVYYIKKGFIATLQDAVIHAIYHEGNDLINKLNMLEGKNETSLDILITGLVSEGK